MSRRNHAAKYAGNHSTVRCTRAKDCATKEHVEHVKKKKNKSVTVANNSRCANVDLEREISAHRLWPCLVARSHVGKHSIVEITNVNNHVTWEHVKDASPASRQCADVAVENRRLSLDPECNAPIHCPRAMECVGRN